MLPSSDPTSFLLHLLLPINACCFSLQRGAGPSYFTLARAFGLVRPDRQPLSCLLPKGPSPVVESLFGLTPLMPSHLQDKTKSKTRQQRCIAFCQVPGHFFGGCASFCTLPAQPPSLPLSLHTIEYCSPAGTPVINRPLHHVASLAQE